MNSIRIYNRRIRGLDKNVWVFMAVFMILSLTLLTSFLIERKKCIPFSLKISPASDSGYYTEKTLSFSLSTSSKNITWDFGDGTSEKKGGFVTHQYHKANKYIVKAGIRPDCYEEIEITVKKSPLDHSVGNEISGPETVPVEKDFEFSCRLYARTWTWLVSDHPEIKAKNEKLGTASFRFSNAGKYFIQVTLDSNILTSYRKEITVTDDRIKPQTPYYINPQPLLPPGERVKDTTAAVLKSKIFDVDERTFKEMLNAVIKDDDSSPTPEDFYKYLVKRENTDVKIIGVQKLKFNSFYNQLRKNRNLHVTDVKLDRDPNDNLKVLFIIVSLTN